jgi:hypothetical protein
MGLETVDVAFILIGALMMIASFVLYFAMKLWPNLKTVDPSFPAAQPMFMSFGLACFTNGWLVGYGAQMPSWAAVMLFVVMIASLIWCAFTFPKMHKAVYSKQTTA